MKGETDSPRFPDFYHFKFMYASFCSVYLMTDFRF